MQATHETTAIPAVKQTVIATAAQPVTAAQTMHAIVHRQYGEPDVLTFEEVARPVPGELDVLVRVHAAGATIGDHHVVTGKPYLIRLSPFGGFPGPKHRVPGQTLAGVVAAVGAKVASFRVGDEVYGQAERGAFAEYAVVPAKRIARRPANLTFEQAAAVPWGTTALEGLRDVGGVKPGHRVLIHGASGGVGTWAVQIARALGAHVTAVCSTRNVEMVRGLGADEVIDYTKDDFVKSGARFDVMMDMIGDRALSDVKSVLTPTGRYVPCSGGGGDWVGPFVRVIAGLILFAFGGRKFAMFVQSPKHEDLVAMTELIEAGEVKPVLERTYPLREAGEALRHVGAGHARGQTVIRIAG